MIERQYEDNTLEAAFENAIDCLAYGYGKNTWNNLGISEEAQIKVWNKAKSILEKM